MKQIVVALFILFSFALSRAAAPIGPVEAIYYSVYEGGSTALVQIRWLQPNGTYTVLSSYSRTSSFKNYASGQQGTYELTVNASDSTLRDIAFDGRREAVLNLTTHTASDFDGLNYTFALMMRSPSAAVVNTSSRSFIDPTHPAIAGLSLAQDRVVLVRAVGPGLAQFGVTDPVSAPKLAIYFGPNVIAQDTGWTSIPEWKSGLQSAAALAGAFPLAESDADSATLIYLAAGTYTAQALPLSASSGTVLVESYVLPYASI